MGAAKGCFDLRGVIGDRSILLSAQASAVSWPAIYRGYVQQAFYFDCFLILGLGWSIMAFGRGCACSPGIRPSRQGRHSLRVAFVLCGSSFCSARMRSTSTRGVSLSTILGEFLPPLVIVLSAWVVKSIPSLRRDRVLEWSVLGGLCLSGGLFLIQAHYPESFGIGHHASLAIALTTLFTFSRRLYELDADELPSSRSSRALPPSSSCHDTGRGRRICLERAHPWR